MDKEVGNKLAATEALAATDKIQLSAHLRHRAKDIDRHVGGRIRQRRVMLGLTQQQMADLIGVTYQQAHKYERGINRISAGRLYAIGEALGVEISFFYEGITGSSGPSLSARQRMCLELARNFTQIPSERHQEALSFLARALAVPSAEPE